MITTNLAERSRSRQSRALATLVAASALTIIPGCGSTTESPPDHRLHPRWQVAGGARRLIGWHDTKLGLDCRFEGYVAEREHRCIPHVATVSRGYLFADAACTEPLAVPSLDIDIAEACATPQYAIAVPEDSCAAGPRFYEIGPPVDPASAFAFSGSTCAPAVGSPERLYRIGAAVPETTFAAATEKPGETGQLWLVTDDGVEVPWGGWDGVRAVQPAHTTDGHLRWAPWIVAYEVNYTFADAACTVPAAGKSSDTARCPLDAVLRFGPSGQCGGLTVSFAELGAPLETVHQNNQGPCVAVPAAGSGQLDFHIGAPIPDEQLIEAGTVDEGDGPVKVRYATMNGNPIHQTMTDPSLGGNGPPRPDIFVDAASGLICEPQLATDGKTRCLPIATSLSSLVYADPACTQPVISEPAPAAGCAAPVVPSVIAYRDDSSLCGPSAVHVRPVESALPSGAPLYYSSAGACMTTPGAPDAKYRRLGNELPAEAFAEVTVEIEQ